MFKLSQSWADPPAGGQRGFPAPGASTQTVGPPLVPEHGGAVAWEPERPTQGRRTFWGRTAASTRGVAGQQGFPAVEDAAQARPAGSMPNVPPLQPAQAIMVWTPYYSRGADAYVPNFGRVLFNPIGAGVVARYRPQASYGQAAQYLNSSLWWTSQDIPTSIDLQGLTDPEGLAEILDSVTVQAVMREP